MSRHLSPEELLALAEGPGPLEHGHAAHCETCRREVEDLRAVVRRVRSAEVPEPSPLFWDHLSRRIQEAVAQDDAPVRRPAPFSTRWLAAALPLTAAVALALGVMSSAPDVDPARETGAMIAGDVPHAVSSAEPEWQFLVGLLESSEEMDAEDWSAVEVGEAEQLVASLDGREQAALVALLQEEVRHHR